MIVICRFLKIHQIMNIVRSQWIVQYDFILYITNGIHKLTKIDTNIICTTFMLIKKIEIFNILLFPLILNMNQPLQDDQERARKGK